MGLTSRLLAYFREQAAVVEEEIASLRDSRPRRSSVRGAVAATAGIAIGGNAVVMISRAFGGNHGEVVTIAANPLLAAVAYAAMRRRGLHGDALGLRWPSRQAAGRWWWPGVASAGAVTLIIVASLLAGGKTGKGLSVRMAIPRLLVGTASAEEFLHRGLLLSLWASTRVSTRTVVAVNGIAFGAWHVAGAAPKGAYAAIGEVLFTAVIGAPMLLWLRCRSKSIAAPILAHVAANIAGSVPRPP